MAESHIYLNHLVFTMDFFLQPGGAPQGYQGPAPGQPMPHYPGAPATNPSMPGYGSGAPSHPQAPAISVRHICLHRRTSLKLHSHICMYSYKYL